MIGTKNLQSTRFLSGFLDGEDESRTSPCIRGNWFIPELYSPENERMTMDNPPFEGVFPIETVDFFIALLDDWQCSYFTS